MNKRTLIIVDNDRSFVEAVSIFLGDHGYHTIPASSGHDGLSRLLSGRVDLAIIDVRLPDISGIDVAKTLRRAGRDIPLILISGDDDPEVQAQCQAAGAQMLLPKPLAPEKLLTSISQVLDSGS